ncbi:MAG: glycosyltransferase family 2 protein [Candidatus Bathyarchaeia archaeon]
MVSIIVPVKDEEKVVNRLLKALLKLDYPTEKMEILIVEDGSSDKTVEICMEYVRRYPNHFSLLRKPTSNGKPSALNYALKHAKGEIVAFFDADNVPEPDALKRAINYFVDRSVAAVQGRLCSINADENMLAKLVSYEDAVWCEVYLRGKDVLDLFVHLKGSCQFIRYDILTKVGGFDEDALSEDMELSARLAENGYRIRYAPDVCAWQEMPADLTQLFKQRVRWFRGTMETAFKYGRLMTKLNRRSLDAEVTLIGPLILISSLVTYLTGVLTFFSVFHFDVLWNVTMTITTFISTFMILICGLALVYISKPKKVTNLLWLPFIWFYWSLQAFIAFYVLIVMFLRKPKTWHKTEKRGTITSPIGFEGGKISES